VIAADDRDEHHLRAVLAVLVVEALDRVVRDRVDVAVAIAIVDGDHAGSRTNKRIKCDM